MIRKVSSAIFSSCIITMAFLSAPTVFAVEADESISTTTDQKTSDAKITELESTPIPAADVTKDTDVETAAVTLKQYVVQESNGQPRFDSEKAEKDNASEYLMDTGEEFNKISEYHAKNSEFTQEGGMPIHGNWCGPGHSGPDAPIDTLDSLCQKHDNCYGSRGYFACSCDAELVLVIKNTQFGSEHERKMATAIMLYFTISGCNPFA